MMRLLLIFCLLAPASAAADTLRHYSAEYRLYVAGILLGRADVRLQLSADSYRLNAYIAPAALGRLFGQTHVVTATQGQVADDGFVPHRLDLSWTSEDGIKSTVLLYEDGAPVEFRSDYEPDPEFVPEDPVDIATVGPGTVDPFLVLLNVLPAADAGTDGSCGGERRIFDGRRIAVLDPQPFPLTEKLQKRFAAYADVAACEVVWTPIAGYSKRSLERAGEYPPGKLWSGRIADSAFSAPLEIKAGSRFGRVRVTAVQPFAEAPAPLPPFRLADIVKQPAETEEEPVFD